VTGDLKPNGMATAVALAGGAGDLGLEEDQDDLFGAECDGPLSPAPVGKSGPQGGRPKGARNKSTEALRQLFMRRYRSPLMGLGEIYSRTPEQLARELKLFKRVTVLVERDGKVVRQEAEDEGELDLEKAFRLQMEAMSTALPYVHQKLPQAVTVEDRSRGLLVINMAGDGQVDDAQIVFAPVEQNQRVIDAEPVQSEDDKSETLKDQMDGSSND
jgi:hypothetical protein